MRLPARALALLVLAAGGLSTGVTASPQPTPVCGVCGGGLAFAADGVDDTDALRGLTVRRSVATVRVHDDGSATWHVTNRLANESAIDYLHEHPRVLDRLATEALEYSTVEGPFRNVSATIDGATVRVRFEDPDAARRMPGGVHVVEYLHSRGYDSWPVVTADRLTLVGPEGTTVTNDPPDAQVEGRNATWRGNASAPLYDAPTVGSDAYVAFAGGGPGTGLWTALDVAIATAPIVVGVAASILLPPLVLLAVGLLAMMAGGRRVPRRSRLRNRRLAALGVATLGALAFVASALGAVFPPLAGHRWMLGLGAVYLAVGSVAYWRGPETRVRDLLAAGVVALVGVALSLGLTLPDQYVTQSEAIRRGVHEAVRLVPVLAMVALGAAVGGGRGRAATGALAVLGAFLVAELTVVWPTQRPFGPVLLVFLAGAVGVALLGSPLFLLGGAVGRGGAAGDGSETP